MQIVHLFFYLQVNSVNLEYYLHPPNDLHLTKKRKKNGRCDCTLSLCDWDICSTADTAPCRPALFQIWAPPSSNQTQECFPFPLLHLLDWSQYTAAPGAITDMLRPSVKPLSATYQHTLLYKNFPLCHTASPPLPAKMILELFLVHLRPYERKFDQLVNSCTVVYHQHSVKKTQLQHLIKYLYQ